MSSGGAVSSGGGRFGMGREGMIVPQPPVAVPGDKKGAVVAVPKQPRYEFVILFLWKEPIRGSIVAASADAAKKE